MRTILSCLLALFIAQAHVPQPSDTLYTARAAMLIYGTDPERALTIIDSALIVGNVDAYEADYLRAKVYAHSPVNHRLDEAIALCEDLLQRDSTLATFRDQFKRQFGMTPTEYRLL